MSDPRKLTLHEGDVTWFIELYTAAAIEWLSLLMTVAKTNYSSPHLLNLHINAIFVTGGKLFEVCDAIATLQI